MKLLFHITLILMLTGAGCKSSEKTAETISAKSEKSVPAGAEGPENSIVRAEFLRSVAGSKNELREAYIRIDSIIKRGFDYHGQYTENDEIAVVFAFGYGDLPGSDREKTLPLAPGDLFRAELIQDGERITVYHYEKI